jgi:hypothetical protein
MQHVVSTIGSAYNSWTIESLASGTSVQGWKPILYWFSER